MTRLSIEKMSAKIFVKALRKKEGKSCRRGSAASKTTVRWCRSRRDYARHFLLSLSGTQPPQSTYSRWPSQPKSRSLCKRNRRWTICSSSLCLYRFSKIPVGHKKQSIYFFADSKGHPIQKKDQSHQHWKRVNPIQVNKNRRSNRFSIFQCFFHSDLMDFTELYSDSTPCEVKKDI